MKSGKFREAEFEKMENSKCFICKEEFKNPDDIYKCKGKNCKKVYCKKKLCKVNLTFCCGWNCKSKNKYCSDHFYNNMFTCSRCEDQFCYDEKPKICEICKTYHCEVCFETEGCKYEDDEEHQNYYEKI